MAKIQRRIKPRRVFSESIKQREVKVFETGEYKVLELGKLYGVKEQTIYNWIKKYSPADRPQYWVVEMADSTDRLCCNGTKSGMFEYLNHSDTN